MTRHSALARVRSRDDHLRTPRLIALAAATSYILAASIPCDSTPLGVRLPRASSTVRTLAASSAPSTVHTPSQSRDPSPRHQRAMQSTHPAAHEMAHARASAPSSRTHGTISDTTSDTNLDTTSGHDHDDLPSSRHAAPQAEAPNIVIVAPCPCGCDQPVSVMAEVRSLGQVVPPIAAQGWIKPARDLVAARPSMIIEGLVVPIEHVPISA